MSTTGPKMTTCVISIKDVSEMWDTFPLCEPLRDEESLTAKSILRCCEYVAQRRSSLNLSISLETPSFPRAIVIYLVRLRSRQVQWKPGSQQPFKLRYLPL
jgi:hypothetical protein